MNVALPPQTYLSFFSGAGGLDLAVGLAVPDARCIGYVEIELPAAAILAARIAEGSVDEAPVWFDIRTFPSELYRGRVAGAVFGFPCQDLSVAGKQEGLVEGTRSGLFFSAMRVVRAVGCEWCFLENVPPVLSFPAGHAVLRELAESGFDAEWISLRAADVGASHRRERVFILAHRTSRGLGKLRESSRCAGFIGRSDAGLADAAISGRNQDRRGDESMLREAARPEGRDGLGSAGSGCLGDASFTRLEGRELGDPRNGNRGGQTAHGSTEQPSRTLFPPGPADREQWAAIIGERPDLAPAVEYEVRGMASRIAGGLDFARPDQLRCLGNMVVPQQGALAFLVLLDRSVTA